MPYLRIACNDKSVTYICEPSWFYLGFFCLVILIDMDECRTYKKESVLSILDCCSLLPQDFGQLLVQIILYFIKKM